MHTAGKQLASVAALATGLVLDWPRPSHAAPGNCRWMVTRDKAPVLAKKGHGDMYFHHDKEDVGVDGDHTGTPVLFDQVEGKLSKRVTTLERGNRS